MTSTHGRRATQNRAGTLHAGAAALSDIRLWRQLGWIFVLIAWLFLTASLLGFDPGDRPTHTVYPPNERTTNWCGPAGAAVAYAVFKALGSGVWMLVLGVGGWLAVTAGGYRVGLEGLRLVGLLIIAGAFAGVQGVLFPSSGPFPDLAGGLVGEAIAHQLSSRFHALGSLLILAASALVGGIVAFDKWVFLAPLWVGQRAAPIAAKAGAGALAGARTGASAAGDWSSRVWARMAKASAASQRSKGPAFRANDIDDDASVPRGRDMTGRRASAAVGRRARAADVDKADDAPATIASEEAYSRGSQRALRGKPATTDAPPARRSRSNGARQDQPPQDQGEASDPVGAYVEDNSSPNEASDGGSFDPQELREKIAKLPIVFAKDSRKVATQADLDSVQSGSELAEAAGDAAATYEYPPLDLLEDPEENFTERLESLVREQAQALEAALRQYRIDGEVVGIESGPVITLYDVRLAPGTKVSVLQAVASDIARALKAVNIRIVANQVGRDTVGVEVPNPTKEKVRLKELMGKSELFSRMKLPMFLGKDASGEPLIGDLTKMPHMLIAGTTGSGKSVCMNTIIMSFLYTKRPSELRMVLVDPKMVEMSQFKDIPHLMCPVVTEMSKAAAILEWATRKMDERYELLAEAGCRDITGYNELTWEELRERLQPGSPEEEKKIPRKLPYMVFIIDELADLMMTNKEVEGSIIRIAQKARAVGIHLILATQRPQANVVTGLIKSNMPCRITFKVASGMDSRIVLDQKGGELLLGMGDMLFLSPSSHKLVRAQGTLVDDLEIRKVVKHIRDRVRVAFDPALVNIRANMSEDEQRIMESKNNSSASLAAAQEDPMFERAVEIVLETKRGSVSLLQRRLAIGYTRASRLIDLMGIAGIIGEHKGSVAREVAISEAEWQAMKEQAAADAAQGLLPGQNGQTQLFADAGDPQLEQPPFDVDAGIEDSDEEGVDEEEPEDSDEEGSAGEGEEWDEEASEADEESGDAEEEEAGDEDEDEYDEEEEEYDEEDDEDEEEEADLEVSDEVEDEESDEDEDPAEPQPPSRRQPRRG